MNFYLSNLLIESDIENRHLSLLKGLEPLNEESYRYSASASAVTSLVGALSLSEVISLIADDLRL
jgi:hypothetical protein